MNGLTTNEIEIRKKNNQVNYDYNIKTNSYTRIIFKNLFSWFNILNFILAFLVVTTNSYKNLLFMGVVFCNTLISIIQTIRSKKIIDKLKIVNANKVKTIRNGKEEQININEVVLDDIIIYKLGDQIITNATILKGEAAINESNITGESDTIYYKENDKIKSGSFVVSGQIIVKVTSVGKDNYIYINNNCTSWNNVIY